MIDTAIHVENLGKRFRSYHADRPGTLKEAILRGLKRLGPKEVFWALRDVSFRVEKGKMVGIIGTNGAGKSTLLRLIGGVGRADAGTVRVAGRIGALLDVTTGFHPDLTGRENIFISGVIAGLIRREVQERMDRIVQFAELEEFIDNPIRTYSTGMQMRLGFAVAAHTDPDVLLIDEVLAVGDIAFQQKCMARIAQFKQEGRTIVLVSHDPAQIKQFCDEVIWLKRGRLIAQGNPEVIAGEYVAETAAESRRRTPAERPAVLAPSGAELRMNVNRFGSMEAEIMGVALLDRRGRSVSEITSGDPLSVGIDYCASQAIPEPIFSVGLSREDGAVCFETNTAVNAVTLASIEGRGRMVLHLDRLDLPPGKYFVDTGIYKWDWEYGYDYHWHVYPLTVRGGIACKGFLCPPQRWEAARGNQPRPEESPGKIAPQKPILPIP
jgi:lipopolysaccharide transport system ATP-binding protein